MSTERHTKPFLRYYYQDTVAEQAGSCSIITKTGPLSLLPPSLSSSLWLDMGTDDCIEDAVSFQQCNSFLQMVVLQSMVSFKTSGGV